MEYGRMIFTQWGWMPVKEKKPMTGLEKILIVIEDALTDPSPHPALIYAARYVLTEYDRDDVPDWIEALANANAEVWEDAIDEVRRLKLAEEQL